MEYLASMKNDTQGIKGSFAPEAENVNNERYRKSGTVHLSGSAGLTREDAHELVEPLARLSDRLRKAANTIPRNQPR